MKKTYSYEIVREGSDVILKIDYEKAIESPLMEEDSTTMSRVINILLETGHVTKIIFSQKRDFEYAHDQVLIIEEIANLYNHFVKDRELLTFLLNVPEPCKKDTSSRHGIMQRILYTMMRKDPIGAYVELHRQKREQILYIEQYKYSPGCKDVLEKFVKVLEYMAGEFEKSKIIQLSKPYLVGYKIGDRSVYQKIFNPTIKPDFMFTKLMAAYPQEGEILKNYMVGETEVTIFSLPDSVSYLYHMVPPEFKLSEEQYDILDTARNIMSEHKPSRSDFINPALMREVFHNVGKDLIEELIKKRGSVVRQKEIDTLTAILVRYTVGFGIIEILLQDPNIQDISINSPMGNIPMFLVHGEFGDCTSNIIPTPSDGDSWATKLRLISGRPLDEANPVLDTEIELPGARARIAVVSSPLNPNGIAYSWRRHRIKPWTLPLFIKYNFLNATAAGLISFLVDGSRTMLVAGTRSAGKSSLLGSLLVEIMRRARIITIEDTLELPSDALRELGYNIQQLKVAAALSKGSSEVAADEGIRTTLRLGDSALFVGEVRSKEARALYEAMRVGALANVVAGTIHGDSPYGVYDRVVNDLDVPKTSFKATDIIIVANPIRSPDGMHRWRRVTQITEIRKTWENDPLLEGGFVDLMTYDSETDQMVISPALMNGESEILKAIAGSVKEWAGNWDAVWDNIMLRARIKQRIVDAAEETKNDDILEAKFVIAANDQFHKASERVRAKEGKLDSEKIYFEWESWLKTELSKKKYGK